MIFHNLDLAVSFCDIYGGKLEFPVFTRCNKTVLYLDCKVCISTYSDRIWYDVNALNSRIEKRFYKHFWGTDCTVETLH